MSSSIGVIMTTLLLSRIQFGVSVGFHYLFPVATLGLTFLIVLFESLFIIRKNTAYRDISSYFTTLLGPIFTVGVATGLVMPFAFGTNWERFSAFAGAFFGSALSIEAMVAFAFESAFLAILLFGRSKVSPGLYWCSALFVFLGSHFSGFLIVAANSWLQTPAGFIVENGRVVVTDFVAAILNHSTLVRFVHVITAAWCSGAFIATAIASWYLFKRNHEEFSRLVLRFTLPLMLIFTVLQPLWGHFQIMEVLRWNPEKDAAYEGIFHTVKGAPLYAFGIPDVENEKILFGIGLPFGLSLLESGNPFSEVKGLDEFPRENWPPVAVIFTTFHLMVMVGMIMLGIAALGMFLQWKRKLESARWYLALLPWCVPLPFIANELGWIGTEIGRQPWMIYKVLKTAEASTVLLPPWQAAVSLATVSCIYLLLALVTARFVGSVVRNGPVHKA
jgi:cytochrome d ubiquinol oxidase subunit I